MQWLSHSAAAELIRHGRNGRKKLQNNTYLEQRGEDFAVRLHNTDVVTIHADGTCTLNTGGWDTVTTKDRINSYSPARVSSERGTWYIASGDDPRTPPKVQKCRGCKGTGQRHQAAQYSHGEWCEVERDVSGDYADGMPHTYMAHEFVRFETPLLISEAHDYECYSCNGTGQQDYGSKPMPVLFFDGIRVDSDGNVIDADNCQRLREPAEVTGARHLLENQRREIVHQRRVNRHRAEREERDWYAQSTEYLVEQRRRQETARQERENHGGGGRTYTGQLTTTPYETSDSYEPQGAPDTNALLDKISSLIDGDPWTPLAHP
jgi:hypothetical protein